MQKQVINLGIVGFGTVGTGVVKVLKNSASLLEKRTGTRFVIKRIVDIDIKKRRDIRIPSKLLSTKVSNILNDKSGSFHLSIVIGIPINSVRIYQFYNAVCFRIIVIDGEFGRTVAYRGDFRTDKLYFPLGYPEQFPGNTCKKVY